MSQPDANIHRALTSVAAAAPEAPDFATFADTHPEPPQRGRRGLVLVAAAVLVAIAAIGRTLWGGGADDTRIVDTPTPLPAPTATATPSGPDEPEDVDAIAPPAVAGMHPEFRRMLANDGQPSTTGSGFDAVPCGETPPVRPEAETVAESVDHVRAVEVHKSDECVRTVFVLGTDAASGGRTLDIPALDENDDRGGLIRVATTGVPQGIFSWDLTVVPGSDLLDTSHGFTAVIGQNAYFGLSSGWAELWTHPARLVYESTLAPSGVITDPTDIWITQGGGGAHTTRKEGRPVSFRFIEPGSEPGHAVLREAPGPGEPQGSGALVEATWTTYPAPGSFDVATLCSVQFDAGHRYEVTHDVSRYTYAPEATGLSDIAFSILDLAQGRYEVMFEGPTGDEGTFLEFEVVPCVSLVLNADSATLYRDGEAISRPFELGESATDVAAEIFAIIGEGSSGEHHLCPDYTRHGWHKFWVLELNRSVVAYSGVTTEGIGYGTIDTELLEVYGTDIRQPPDPAYTGRPVGFTAGPYKGTYFEYWEEGANRVDAMWNGTPVFDPGDGCQTW